MTLRPPKTTLTRIALPLALALSVAGGSFAQAPTTTTPPTMTSGGTTETNGVANTDLNAPSMNAPSGTVSPEANATGNAPMATNDPMGNTAANTGTNSAMGNATTNDPSNAGLGNAPADANLPTNTAPTDANATPAPTTTPTPTRPGIADTASATTEETAPSNLPLIAGAVVAVLVIAGVVFFALKGRRPGQIIASNSDGTKK
ncbi:hypothetical protein EON77_00215 [bacterium]|nr:MAG: hypothetical protein EON77_00215 [bacterium]